MAHRLPGPIIEESSPAQSVRPRQKNIESDSKLRTAPTSKFDGTWKGTSVKKDAIATYASNSTLAIRDGKTADTTTEFRAALLGAQGWTDLPEEYKRLSLIHFKFTNHSDHLVRDGASLMVRWAGRRLVDWGPKQLPIKYFEQWLKQNEPSAAAFTVKGNELAVGNSDFVYHRVK